MNNQLLLAGTLLALVTLSIGPVVAQPAPAGPVAAQPTPTGMVATQPTPAAINPMESGSCGYMCHVPMAWHGGGGAMAWYGSGPKEGTLEQMKAHFAIKPEQEKAWDTFRSIVIAQTVSQLKPPMPTPGKPPSAVEQARYMEKIWHERVERMQSVVDSFHALYAVLEPQQREIADRRFGYCDLPRTANH